MRFSHGARRAWEALGGEGFLSLPVFVAFLSWSIPSVVYVEAAVAGGPLLPWLAAASLVSLTVASLLAVLAVATRSWWPDGPGPGRAATVYLAAGALRGVLLWAASAGWNLETSVLPISRVIQSALWGPLLMGSVTVVVTFQRNHRRAMGHLAQRQEELLELRSSLGERIDQTRRDLIGQVQQQLAPTLAHLRAQLDALATTPGSSEVESAVDGFRTAVADVVRPLSRTLAQPPTSVPSAPAPPSGVWFAAERLPVADAIRPLASTALLLCLAVPLALGLAPEESLNANVPVRLGLLAAFLWLALAGFKRLAAAADWRLAVPLLVPTLAGAFSALGLANGAIGQALTAGLPGPAVTFPALAVALCVLPPLVVSLASIRDDIARAAERRLEATVGQLELLTAVLRRELWRERRRLALTVHGPVQSALVAAAITMSRPGFAAEQVPALATTLDQAMAHINRNSGPPPPVATAARDLASLWVDTAAIGFTASDEATAVVDADESLATAVVEVMREGVSNAVRHGAADTVTIALDLSVDAGVVIRIEDNGDGPPLAAAPGLGSSLLDEISRGWSLIREGGVTRLRVELAREPASLT